MMKVAYLMGGLERGGTETLLLDTLRHARKVNLPCLMVHRKNGALLPAFRQTGIPLYRLSMRHPLDFGYLLRLRRLLLHEGVQVVHAQLPLDAFLAYWACVGTKTRILLSVHGYDIGYGRLAKSMLRFILRRTDKNLFVSTYLREHYESVYALKPLSERQNVVYNGIDFGKFTSAVGSTLRRELGMAPDTLLLGSVGNFVPGRDQLTVCRFLERLQSLGVDFQSVFIGARSETSPGLYDDCVAFCRTNKLADRVHFLGSRSDVPSLLTELDAFVYASDHDSFGIAVVEAMSAGLPVFVNEWPVMQEVTRDGAWATLYKTKDVDDLTAKFLHFLEHRADYRSRAMAAADSVRSFYSIQQHIRNLKKQYDSVL